jgi:predicted ATPase
MSKQEFLGFETLAIDNSDADYAFSCNDPHLFTGKRLFRHLNHINLFVGPNNSGKSRLLRFLAKQQELDFYPILDGLNWETIFDTVPKDNALRSFGKFKANDASVNNIKLENLTIPIGGEVLISNHGNDNSWIMAMRSLAISKDTYMSSGGIIGDPRFALSNAYAASKDNALVRIGNIYEDLAEQTKDLPRVYIPTTRSLNVYASSNGNPNIIELIGRDIFADRLKQTYGFGDDVAVYTGQTMYQEVVKMLLGDETQRNAIKRFEKFLTEAFFDGKVIEIIPRTESDVLFIKFSDDDERPIYNLGDGIQNLIIMAFPLFQNRSALFFIEEPELSLHPGLQRKFVQMLRRPEFKHHQFFLTTQSNHLIDISIEQSQTSIFLFKRSGRGDTLVSLTAHNDKTPLHFLGALNTSVMLANNSIWIEGITDRLYLRAILKLCLQHRGSELRLTEDADYVFVEYGGANITHWSFLDQYSEEETINVDALAGRQLVIADKDSKSKALERKRALKTKLGDRFIELDRREIENIFKPETIARVATSYEIPASRIEKWLETDVYSTYADEYMGKYLNGVFETTKFATEEGSGTIKDKLKFCKLVLDGLTYEELSDDAIALAEKIIQFLANSKNG